MNSNIIEKSYYCVTVWVTSFGCHIIPILRRIVRFLALPYCYSNINWDLCTKPRVAVITDLLYIFFILKYYPDNYSPCRLWEVPRSEWKFYYGSNYDPYQRQKLRRYMQPYEYEIIFKDKIITDALCQQAGIPMPEILYKIKSGDFISDVVEFIWENNPNVRDLIIKPRNGKGGEGVIYATRNNENTRFILGKEDIDCSGVQASQDLIVQAYIIQHHELTRISDSVNTARVVTLLKPDFSFLMIGAYMRFGSGESKIDNLSQGGICVSISPTKGCLREVGYDRDSIAYTYHPDSGVHFNGVSIPYWTEVIALARQTQYYYDFYRLLGMDIAVTNSGPVLIEVNSSYDNVDLEQANGPILKDTSVLYAYSELDLLINRKQMDLVSTKEDV